MSRPPRVVLAKLGLDGHDVGIKLVSKHLMSGGFEVIYLGKRVRTREVVRAAVDEDAVAIGVSCLSGGLGYFSTKIVEQLSAEGAEIPVLAGGIDEPEEIRRMLAAGVRYHFGPGFPIDEVVDCFWAEIEKMDEGAG